MWPCVVLHEVLTTYLSPTKKKLTSESMVEARLIFFCALFSLLIIYWLPGLISENLGLTKKTLDFWFQSRFDDLWNKFSIYSAGEELFGLPVTEYPRLGVVKKELALLQKLYGLYNTVMVSINSYYDIPWTEVDIEKINGELSDLQNRSLICPSVKHCSHLLWYYLLQTSFAISRKKTLKECALIPAPQCHLFTF